MATVKPVDPVPDGTRWRVIPGVPEFYEVSEYGHVRRTSGPKEHGPFPRVLKPWRTRPGYWRIDLWYDRAHHYRHVHNLVLRAFVGAPKEAGLVGAHGDDDKDNNHIDNLRWATNQQNTKDAVRNGRHPTGARHGSVTKPERLSKGQTKLTEEQVREILTSNETSVTLAARFGVSRPMISLIRHGKAWKHINKGLVTDSGGTRHTKSLRRATVWIVPECL